MASTSRSSTTFARQFRTVLSRWYRSNARDLPWRNTGNPYEVWVSEIMLQQTRVEQALPYFARFVDRFPNVASLAAADLDEVLLLWEGLGYYSRARNLHRSAQIIMEDFGGIVPEGPDDLARLPGIGPYTVAAIGSIAFGLPLPTIDGNVIRVLARFLAIAERTDRAGGKKAIESAARDLIDRSDPGSFNQALMDLGATVCTPSAPACDICPLGRWCSAHLAGSTSSYPVKMKKPRIPHYDVAVGVVSNGKDELLLTRRPEGALLGGLWEFPGAKRRRGESLVDACRRGIETKVGMAVQPGRRLAAVDHAFSHFKITMYAFECHMTQPPLVAETDRPYRWIARSDMSSVALHRAARRIADTIAISPWP